LNPAALFPVTDRACAPLGCAGLGLWVFGGCIVKSIVGVATVLVVCGPVAFAQEPQQPVGSMRLLTTAAAAPTLETPAAATVTTAAIETPVAAPVLSPATPVAPPAAVTPAAAATAWTGPVNFAPVAVVDLLTRVCRACVSGDAGSRTTQATRPGRGDGNEAPDDLARVLANSAITSRTPTVDGEVYLLRYGEDPMNYGTALLRPIPEVAFSKVVELLTAPALGFASEQRQTLAGNVRWERLKSPKGKFIDLMDYPAGGESSGVLHADYLE